MPQGLKAESFRFVMYGLKARTYLLSARLSRRFFSPGERMVQLRKLRAGFAGWCLVHRYRYGLG